MAGKTGTAEYGSASAPKKYAWMITFAPFDGPRYAASMVIEEAVSGGRTVAPRMGKMMEQIFAMEEQAPGATGGA
jgi:peptidoglycan glycosyltransferase/penicillin-binding protein 2